MKSFEDIIDEIIANMDKQREKARIKAFVTDISMMLQANGVIPCMSEVTAEIDDDDALKTVFCCRLEKLDFSEHDKVFKDKIASLEKKNKDLKSCFTQREQDSMDMIMKLKQEKSDKNEKIAELACENESLKQRITELESVEMEKPTKYITVIIAKEINGQTYVTLDDFMSVVNDLQAEIGT